MPEQFLLKKFKEGRSLLGIIFKSAFSVSFICKHSIVLMICDLKYFFECSTKGFVTVVNIHAFIFLTNVLSIESLGNGEAELKSFETVV